MEKMTLIVACKRFFGFPSASSRFTPDLKGFSEEMKELTQKDRDELAAMFLDQGIEVVPADGKTTL